MATFAHAKLYEQGCQ